MYVCLQLFVCKLEWHPMCIHNCEEKGWRGRKQDPWVTWRLPSRFGWCQHSWKVISISMTDDVSMYDGWCQHVWLVMWGWWWQCRKDSEQTTKIEELMLANTLLMETNERLSVELAKLKDGESSEWWWWCHAPSLTLRDDRVQNGRRRGRRKKEAYERVCGGSGI